MTRPPEENPVVHQLDLLIYVAEEVKARLWAQAKNQMYISVDLIWTIQTDLEKYLLEVIHQQPACGMSTASQPPPPNNWTLQDEKRGNSRTFKRGG